MNREESLLDSVRLTCPYCGAINHKPLPPPPKETEPLRPCAHPHQIETMPYTRSKGEFEDEHNWSRIGLDFISELANWESIGILRVEDGDTDFDVSYQLIECTGCKHYFDAYLNWMKDRDFDAFWEFLFERDSTREENDQIKRINRLPWTFGHLERLDNRIRGSFWFTTLVVWLGLFVLSFVPRLAIAYDQNPGSVLSEFWNLSSIALITRIMGGLTIVFLLNHTYKYLTTIRSTDNFYDLFKVQKREHVTHWLNYTLCRITGVQPADGGYAMSQVSVLGGFPSAAILLITWLIAQLNMTAGTLSLPVNLGGLLLLPIVGYLYGSWVHRRKYPNIRLFSTKFFPEPPKHPGLKTWLTWFGARKIDWFVPVNGRRVRGVVWGLGAWVVFVLAQIIIADPTNWKWVTDGVFEVLFWMAVAYYIGLHIYLAFNLSVYVLFQFSRIPLNVHPLLGFDELTPIKLLTNISSQILIAILLLVLALIGLQVLPWEQMGISLPSTQVLQNTMWLSDWFTIGLLIMFFLLSLLIISWIPPTILLGGSAIFFGVWLLGNAWIESLSTCTQPVTKVCSTTQVGFDVHIVKFLFNGSEITVWPSLIVVGIAIYLGIVYISIIQDQYKKLLEQVKEPYIGQYNRRIRDLSHALLDDSAEAEDVPLPELIEVRDYLAKLSVEDDNTMLRLLIARVVTIAFSLGPPSLQIFGQMLGF